MGKDFGDIEVKSKYAEKYKGKVGETHRIGIIYPKVGGGPFEEGFTHYVDKHFFCKNGVCCEKKGPPDQRFACLVVQYKTDKQGRIIQTGNTIPFDHSVKAWVVGAKKMKQLLQKNGEFPLKSHDLMVTCEGNEDYQNLDFTPCKESVWQMKPEFKETILLQSERMRNDLKNNLGQDLSTDEIKELFGLNAAVDISNVLTNTEDVNKLLADV